MIELIIWLIYRAFVISVGLVCIVLGYKLLVKGVFDGGADISGAWDKNKKLIIRRASPGALLFIFGFGIISISILFSKFTGNGDVITVGSPPPSNRNVTSEQHPVMLSKTARNDTQESIASLDESKENKEDEVSPEQSKSRSIFSVQGKKVND